MEFGMETIFGMTNSILAFIFEIDTFFIKYIRSDDKVSKTYKERSHNNEIRYGDYFLTFIFEIDDKVSKHTRRGGRTTMKFGANTRQISSQ